MKINTQIFETKDSYEISINNNESEMSTGYMVGMIIGFIFFMVIGIVMLVLWLVKNQSTNNNSKFIISKDNWEEDLDKQLLILDTNLNKNEIKKSIQNKIKFLNK